MIRVRKAVSRPLVFHLDGARVAFACPQFRRERLGLERRPGLLLTHQRAALRLGLPEPRLSERHLQHFYDKYWLASEEQHAKAEKALEESAESPAVQQFLRDAREGNVEGPEKPAVLEHLQLRERGGYAGQFKALNEFGAGSPAEKQALRRQKAQEWGEKNIGSPAQVSERISSLNEKQPEAPEERRIKGVLAKQEWETMAECVAEKERADYYEEFAGRVRFFHEQKRGERVADEEAERREEASEMDELQQTMETRFAKNRPLTTDKDFRMYRYLQEMYTYANLQTAAVNAVLSPPSSAQLHPSTALALLRLAPGRAPDLPRPEDSPELRVAAASHGFTFSFAHHAKQVQFTLSAEQVLLLQEFIRFTRPLIMDWHSDTIYLEPSENPHEQYLHEAEVFDLLGRFKTKREMRENQLEKAQRQRAEWQSARKSQAGASPPGPEEPSFDQQKLKEAEELRAKLISTPPQA